MLKRSDSPENKHIDSTGHGRAKAVHTHRARDRDGGEIAINGQGEGVLIKNKLLLLRLQTQGGRCSFYREHFAAVSFLLLGHKHKALVLCYEVGSPAAVRQLRQQPNNISNLQ